MIAGNALIRVIPVIPSNLILVVRHHAMTSFAQKQRKQALFLDAILLESQLLRHFGAYTLIRSDDNAWLKRVAIQRRCLLAIPFSSLVLCNLVSCAEKPLFSNDQENTHDVCSCRMLYRF